jgi:hypothetical protein
MERLLNRLLNSFLRVQEILTSQVYFLECVTMAAKGLGQTRSRNGLGKMAFYELNTKLVMCRVHV